MFGSLRRILTGLTLWALASVSAFAGPVAVNATGLEYSPYNWSITSTKATTINAGAYLRMMFSGASLTLTFDVSNNSTPLSQIMYRVDGYGPWIVTPVAASVAITLPADTSAYPYHHFELVVKSTSETINRWVAPSNTAVVLTGITLASGGVILPMPAPTKNALFLGDSITEGVRTVNETATNDTDRNDATQSWAFRQRDLLNAGVGLVGFGSQGFTKGGSGGVPALGASLGLIAAGIPRTFTPAPDLVVLNMGTNDGSAAVGVAGAAAVSVLNSLLTATPGTTKIAVMRPFNANNSAATARVISELQAAIATVGSSRVSWVDTAGSFVAANGADSINLHPTGANNAGQISPKTAAALSKLLATSSGSVFRPSLF